MKTKKASHTPGPWDLEKKHGRVDKVYGEGITIADMPKCQYQEDIDESDANARLIAAAPDLLKTLEFMRANYANSDYPSDQEAIELMDAAIAKSYGKIK